MKKWHWLIFYTYTKVNWIDIKQRYKTHNYDIYGRVHSRKSLYKVELNKNFRYEQKNYVTECFQIMYLNYLKNSTHSNKKNAIAQLQDLKTQIHATSKQYRVNI